MNKEDLIAAIAAESKFTKVDSAKFLDAYINVVTAALQLKDDIRLIGFCNLSVIDKPARTGRNPRSGEAITIPASKAVKFVAGKNLKEAVNA